MRLVFEFLSLLIVQVTLTVAEQSALPHDPVASNLDDGLQNVQEPDASPPLLNLLGTVTKVFKYNPDRQNVYRLYTRQNPKVGQRIVMGKVGLLGLTNFNANRRTIVIIHGWLATVISDFNTVLISAFLSAEDVNVIAVDWSAAAGSLNYDGAVANTVVSGESVARFIKWLNSATGAVPGMYHIVGHGLGAHQAGIVSRIVGDIPYLTGLDPARPGWENNEYKLKDTDAAYTEVIHSNAGNAGYQQPLGAVDFYPNEGRVMPGCLTVACNHNRSFNYFAESLQSGGFTGRRCENYQAALVGNCTLSETLNMGGIKPKTGKSGVYYLETNSSPLYSRG